MGSINGRWSWTGLSGYRERVSSTTSMPRAPQSGCLYSYPISWIHFCVVWERDATSWLSATQAVHRAGYLLQWGVELDRRLDRVLGYSTWKVSVKKPVVRMCVRLSADCRRSEWTTWSFPHQSARRTQTDKEIVRTGPNDCPVHTSEDRWSRKPDLFWWCVCNWMVLSPLLFSIHMIWGCTYNEWKVVNGDPRERSTVRIYDRSSRPKQTFDDELSIRANCSFSQ